MSNLVLIVDHSYSVLNYIKPYTDVVNHFIQKQRQLDSSTRVSLLFFGDTIKAEFVDRPIMNVAPIQPVLVRVGVLTALYDSLGIILRQIPENPTTVIVITDGDDNNSKNQTAESVKVLIQNYKDKGHHFVFLGATENSVIIGKEIGFNVCILYNISEKSFEKVKETTEQILRIKRDADFDLREMMAVFADVKI